MADHPYTFPTDDNQIAYIRSVDPQTLPDDVRRAAAGAEVLYAIHGSDGSVLALVDDRAKAFALARMNELTPVSAH